jgi:hypothetical protein
MLELRAQRATCEWISVNSGYSSVGRASDCRLLQQSDDPWFDSGWPDFSPKIEHQAPGIAAPLAVYGM